MRGDSGVAGEGRVVGVPKFHSCVYQASPQGRRGEGPGNEARYILE